MTPMAAFLQSWHLTRLLLVLALHIAGCCTPSRTTPQATSEPVETFLVDSRAARGAIVLVHGLNQRPSSLDPLAHELRRMGYHVYRPTLRGHASEGVLVFPDSYWEADVVNAYTTVRKQHPLVPTYLIGYSLGGLLITKILDTHPEIQPAGAMLIAPALSLRILPQTGYLLTILPPVSWAVPNVAPDLYRRFARTPLFWYRNIFTLYSATRSLTNAERLRDIPTTIFANPHDELVSLCGLQEWLDDNQLAPQWNIETIRPAPAEPNIPSHVLIDERSLGSAEWQRMLQTLRSRLTAAWIPHF
jgi:alpha-beta hydrolase superfamily lysophospholipase